MRTKMVDRLLELNLILGVQFPPFGSFMFSGNLGIHFQSSDLIIISVSPAALGCLAWSGTNTGLFQK